MAAEAQHEHSAAHLAVSWDAETGVVPRQDTGHGRSKGSLSGGVGQCMEGYGSPPQCRAAVFAPVTGAVGVASLGPLGLGLLARQGTEGGSPCLHSALDTALSVCSTQDVDQGWLQSLGGAEGSRSHVGGEDEWCDEAVESVCHRYVPGDVRSETDVLGTVVEGGAACSLHLYPRDEGSAPHAKGRGITPN